MTFQNRTTNINRNTKETKIMLNLNLDGSGQSQIATGIGFFDHMLEQVAKHGNLDLDIECSGDTYVDYHHSVEDVGICLGMAIKQALGDKKGVCRYGTSYVPLDESLSRVIIDLSGRAHISFRCNFPSPKIKDFETELVLEFFTALAHNAKMTLHIDNLKGFNSHHISETIFKAFGRSLRSAVQIDLDNKEKIPSTKGTL